MATYKAKKGAMYGDRQAQKLGELMEKFGDHWTPDQIVDAARPAKSPIHGIFEWDNTKAGDAWRRQQARMHVDALEIVIVTKDGKKTTRAYHSVIIEIDGEPQRGYSHIKTIRGDRGLSKQVIEQALRQLQGWKYRYEQYREICPALEPVFKAIEQVASNGSVKRGRSAKRRKQKVPAK